jgi:hypothetical protein
VGFDRAFDHGLTTGVCRLGQRGSIGFNGEVFGVMTQVDQGLTIVSRFDSVDSVISVNDVN